MGFWSVLGDIGGAFIGDPGLGDQIAGLLGDTSQNAGNQAASAAQGRLAQAQAQNQYDRNALDFYNTSLKNALQTPATLTRQAAGGDMLSNLKDVSISGLPSYIHVPQISGGTRPSNLGPNAQQAGQQLSRQALLKLAGNSFALPTMPKQTALPSAGGWENAMSWLGRVGSLAAPTLGAINGMQGSGYQPWNDPANYDENGQFLGGTDMSGSYLPGIYG